METKSIKLPGPDHPISIEPNPARVIVSIAGRTVADTRSALTLRESSYGPVQYIPRKDVDMTLLERTDHHTYCPYKGECAYYSIPLGAERSVNAVAFSRALGLHKMDVLGFSIGGMVAQEITLQAPDLAGSRTSRIRS